MVNISIIIEGGAPEKNSDIDTLNNSNALREVLHNLFAELMNDDVSIEITMQHGYRESTIEYQKKTQSTVDNFCLFVDLDDKQEHIGAWYDKLVTENPDKPISLSDEQKSHVFFMIQAMETWMLYQPDAIERWALKKYKRVRVDENFAQRLEGKDVKDIPHPYSMVNDLLKHYFRYTKDGKDKKVKYTKLVSAAGIIEQIDPLLLRCQDSELQRFCVSIGGDTVK